jgi:hypothetical protein
MKVRLTKEARTKLDDVLDAILSVNPFAAREQTVWIVDVCHGAQLPAEPRLPASREPEPARE